MTPDEGTRGLDNLLDAGSDFCTLVDLASILNTSISLVFSQEVWAK